jgi:hypothetical protein
MAIIEAARQTKLDKLQSSTQGLKLVRLYKATRDKQVTMCHKQVVEIMMVCVFTD